MNTGKTVNFNISSLARSKISMVSPITAEYYAVPYIDKYNYAVLNEVYVNPIARLKGYGTEIIRGVLDYCNTNNVILIAEVFGSRDMSSKDLKRMYLNLGFDRVSDVLIYYPESLKTL